MPDVVPDEVAPRSAPRSERGVVEPRDSRAWHIDWNDDFRMDIPSVDAEHRAFVDLVNKLNARIQSADSCAEVRPIVMALIRDTATHFEHEERWFDQWQYTDRRAHARIHNDILGRLAQLARLLVEETPVARRIQIGLTIRDLLITHIRVEDNKLNGVERD